MFEDTADPWYQRLTILEKDIRAMVNSFGHMSLKHEARNCEIGRKNLGMIPSIARNHAINFPVDIPGNRLNSQGWKNIGGDFSTEIPT